MLSLSRLVLRRQSASVASRDETKCCLPDVYLVLPCPALPCRALPFPACPNLISFRLVWSRLGLAALRLVASHFASASVSVSVRQSVRRVFPAFITLPLGSVCGGGGRHPPRHDPTEIRASIPSLLPSLLPWGLVALTLHPYIPTYIPLLCVASPVEDQLIPPSASSSRSFLFTFPRRQRSRICLLACLPTTSLVAFPPLGLCNPHRRRSSLT